MKQDDVHDIFPKIGTDSQPELMEEVENEDMKKLLSTFTEELGGNKLDLGSFRTITTFKKNSNEIQQHKSKNQNFINKCIL